MPNITKNHAITYTSSLSLRVDFHCRVIFTCVNFTCANKIKAAHEGSLVSVKVKPRSTSRLISTLWVGYLNEVKLKTRFRKSLDF